MEYGGIAHYFDTLAFRRVERALGACAEAAAERAAQLPLK
jgi:hypothetical protein